MYYEDTTQGTVSSVEKNNYKNPDKNILPGTTVYTLSVETGDSVYLSINFIQVITAAWLARHQHTWYKLKVIPLISINMIADIRSVLADIFK